MTSIKRFLCLLLFGLFAGGILCGCSGGGEQDYGRTIGDGDKPPVVDVEAEVKKIEANERMPAQAKQATIASLRAGHARAQSETKAKGK